MNIIFAIAAAVWFAPIAAAQNSPVAGQSATLAPAQPDQPGTPLKPELAGTPIQSEPTGTTLKSESPGTALKSEPPGTPVRSEAAGTPPKPEPPGTALKPEPSGIPVQSEATGTLAKPELPLTPGRPAPAGTSSRPEKITTLSELRKKHRTSVAELKNRQAEEIKTLRESLKEKPQADIRKAVKIKKAEQTAALKVLRDANWSEIIQFKKDHTQPIKRGEDNTKKY